MGVGSRWEGPTCRLQVCLPGPPVLQSFRLLLPPTLRSSEILNLAWKVRPNCLGTVMRPIFGLLSLPLPGTIEIRRMGVELWMWVGESYEWHRRRRRCQSSAGKSHPRYTAPLPPSHVIGSHRNCDTGCTNRTTGPKTPLSYLLTYNLLFRNDLRCAQE